MVLLQEIDCSTGKSRGLATDVYLSSGRMSARLPGQSWTNATPALTNAACGGERVRPVTGRAEGMITMTAPTRWRYLGVGGNGANADTLYVDAETFVRRTGGAAAWLKSVHTTRQKVNDQESAFDLDRWEYDCVGKRTRLMDGASYDSTGKVIVHYGRKEQGDWQNTIPDSMGEGLVRQMCSDKAIPPSKTGQVGPDPQ